MYESTRILIFGKTYPELSSRYTETVCTGGFREDGRPVRLYPVPLRYLQGPQQYQLYEWIRVPIEKSTRDPRPESFKIDPDKIVCEDVIPTDRDGWRQRRDIVFKDSSWHFAGMAELKAAQKTTKRSIGCIRPGAIDDVELHAKPATERAVYAQKQLDLQAKTESDFFAPEYKQLEYLPYEIKLLWRCAERCATCRRRPHRMQVLDWGLLELGRRDEWSKAVDRLTTVADLARYDFRLFLGTFRLHPDTFGIIGLWYPKIPEQQSLL
jgi:hypothetical protein